jgi:hypothetical protein
MGNDQGYSITAFKKKAILPSQIEANQTDSYRCDIHRRWILLPKGDTHPRRDSMCRRLSAIFEVEQEIPCAMLASMIWLLVVAPAA